MERIPYSGELPESFFTIPGAVYAGLSFRPEEDPFIVRRLFREEAASNEVILYTDHRNIRLAGIFPHGSRTCYFGFWETVNNPALNRQAFSLLENDASQRQREVVTGPVNFNTFHQYRLRLGAVPSWVQFDREPVNPAYYPALLEQCGFTPKAGFESHLVRKENIPDIYDQKKELLRQVESIPFDFIPLNGQNWSGLEEEIFGLVHAIFSESPLYRSISTEQFRLLYNTSYAQKLCPYSSVLFRDRQTGRLAAMSFCHPNYHGLPSAPAIRFGDHFARLEKKVLLVKSIGIHPHYRRRGLMNYLGAYTMLTFRERYDEVLFCLMRSGNYSLRFTNGLAYEAAYYALYEKRTRSL